MARSLTEFLARSSGYCCIYNMLEHNSQVGGARLARILGVETHAITYHRKRKAQGLLIPCYDCEHYPPKAPRPLPDRKAGGGPSRGGSTSRLPPPRGRP